LETRAHPGLLNTAAIVLLDRPLTRADIGRVVPYLDPNLLTGLLDNNAKHDVIRESGVAIELSDHGRVLALATVELQERAVAERWDVATDALEVIDTIGPPLVRKAQGGDAPSMPSAFHLFAGVIERPTRPARVLRTITAMRYWRADAHRAALAAADLAPAAAHAFNVMWDVRRGVERVGQAQFTSGGAGQDALEARGLAKDGEITESGFDLRNKIETDTNGRTAPLYQDLNADEADRFLGALRDLPG
jgi:hypothetical protein